MRTESNIAILPPLPVVASLVDSSSQQPAKGGILQPIKVKFGARRPLLETEVPPSLRHLYDFTGQKMGPGRQGYDVSMVQKRCLTCDNMKWAEVSDLRHDLKRKKLTGNCRKCHTKTPRLRLRGKDHFNWKGGKYVSGSGGYMMIRQPKHPFANHGYVLDHRLVMEKHLGRFLFPGETVHHLNGIKTDNRLENLELWAGTHPRGVRYKDLDVASIRSLINELENILSIKEGVILENSV